MLAWNQRGLAAGEAGTLSNLGQLYLQMTLLEEVEIRLQGALTLMRAIGDRGHETAEHSYRSRCL